MTVTASPDLSLDTDDTVNEAVRRVPASVAVFREYGIDACCGGELSIEVACAHHGVDPDELFQRIARLVE